MSETMQLSNPSYMMDIIRHAESQYNAYEKQVRDVKLSERGCLQASNLSGSYDLAIVSTLSRALSTFALSRIIAKETLYTPLCREIRDGNVINYLPGELLERETLDDVAQRVKQFKEILHEPLTAGKRVCIISHYGFIYALTGLRMCNAQIATVPITF
jgi:broad specificity phosphatase PhoE